MPSLSAPATPRSSPGRKAAEYWHFKTNGNPLDAQPLSLVCRPYRSDSLHDIDSDI